MKATKNVTFSWSNYYKPTPQNLEGLAAALRRLVAIIAGTTIIMEAKWYVPFAVVMIGAILDELKNFFSRVNQDYEKTISINIPPEAQENVIITHESEEPKDETTNS